MIRGESCQSFYSMYSHQSIFQQFSPDKNQKFVQEKIIPYQQIKMIKIAQSNFNLDDGVIDPSQNSLSGERKSFETLRTYNQNQKEQIKKQKVINVISQHHQKLLQAHDISQIHPNELNQGLDQSACLIKQIDCLSGDQVNHQQLRQIKNKIQILKKQQLAMQDSLTIANQMLRSAKTRNKILEQEIALYRKGQEIKDLNKVQSNTKLTQVKQGNISRQHRHFPQHSFSQNNQQLARLKTIYKQCSVQQSFCIYQNEGYKIQVFYQHQKHVSDPKMVIVLVKLTPHHHIVSRRQFKFGIQFDKNTKVSSKDLLYDCVTKTQEFTVWPESKFHIEAIIHQFDQSTNKHHTHIVLVPLPITHFFEQRMQFLDQNGLKRIKGSCSQYSLTLTGSIALNWVEKAKQTWWDGKLLSCIGWKQLLLFEISLQQDKNIKIQIYGKKDGKVMTGAIQFLSFFLTS